MNKLFCFGLGYSALALARAPAGRGLAGRRHGPRRPRRRPRSAARASRPSSSTARRPSPIARPRSTARRHLLDSIPPAAEAMPAPPLAWHGADLAPLAEPATGSAISRPPGSTATTAAAGSTRRRRRRRTWSAAAPGRGRSTTGWPWPTLRPAGPRLPPRRHLRPRPRRAASRCARAAPAHRQAGPGLQPHPRRRHRHGAERLDGRAASGRASTTSATTSPKRPTRWSPTPASCSACRQPPDRCRSRRPSCREWREASTPTTSGSATTASRRSLASCCATRATATAWRLTWHAWGQGAHPRRNFCASSWGYAELGSFRSGRVPRLCDGGKG